MFLFGANSFDDLFHRAQHHVAQAFGYALAMYQYKHHQLMQEWKLVANHREITCHHKVGLADPQQLYCAIMMIGVSDLALREFTVLKFYDLQSHV